MFSQKIDKEKCADLSEKFEKLNSLVQKFMEEQSGTYSEKIEIPFAQTRSNPNIEFDAKMRAEEVRLLNDLDDILQSADSKIANEAFEDFVKTAGELKNDIDLLLAADPQVERKTIYQDMVKRLNEILGPSTGRSEMKLTS